MTMDDWRRELLALERAEREAKAAMRIGLDPLQAERAYNAFTDAERALLAHYTIRPAAGR